MKEQGHETIKFINNSLEEISSLIASDVMHDEFSIGHILKQKRLEMRIETSEISSHLRVKKSDIEAIESDDLEAVTKHLYIPGLIKSYSILLKIDQKLIEEKIKLLPIKSNTENKKHQLLNIGEEDNLAPSRDKLLNFLLISIFLFLVLLSIFYAYEDKSGLITNSSLIKMMEDINR